MARGRTVPPIASFGPATESDAVAAFDAGIGLAAECYTRYRAMIAADLERALQAVKQRVITTQAQIDQWLAGELAKVQASYSACKECLTDYLNQRVWDGMQLAAGLANATGVFTGGGRPTPPQGLPQGPVSAPTPQDSPAGCPGGTPAGYQWNPPGSPYGGLYGSISPMGTPGPGSPCHMIELPPTKPPDPGSVWEANCVTGRYQQHACGPVTPPSPPIPPLPVPTPPPVPWPTPTPPPPPGSPPETPCPCLTLGDLQGLIDRFLDGLRGCLCPQAEEEPEEGEGELPEVNLGIPEIEYQEPELTPIAGPALGDDTITYPVETGPF